MGSLCRRRTSSERKPTTTGPTTGCAISCSSPIDGVSNGPGTLMVSVGGVACEESLSDDVVESERSGVCTAGEGERDFVGV